MQTIQNRNRKSATKTAIPENIQQKWTNIVAATTVAADSTPEKGKSLCQ